MPTMRCVMTVLPQPGLERDIDVFRNTARRNTVTVPGLGTYPCAGLYARVTREGTLRVGDPVTVE
jgi:MOSC domain-containing protein YiiM